VGAQSGRAYVGPTRGIKPSKNRLICSGLLEVEITLVARFQASIRESQFLHLVVTASLEVHDDTG